MMMWMVWLLLLITLLLLTSFVIGGIKASRVLNFPPGPKGLPIFGSLFDLVFENPLQYFVRLSKIYGPIYGLQIGTRRVVVISSRELVYQAFSKQGEVFAGVPQGTVMSFIAGGRGLVMAEGQKWRDSRRITVQTLKDFGVGRESIENIVGTEVKALMDTFKENVDKPYDIRHDVCTAVMNIVWHMFVGKRFQMGDRTLAYMVEAVSKTVSLIDQGSFLNFTPIVQTIGTFLRPKAFQILPTLIFRLQYFRQLIDDHHRTLNDSTRNHDLIYSFLKEQQRLKEAGKPLGTFTDWQLMWLLSDLFLAGLDTTASVLRWAVLYLVTHPDITQKLQAEIDEVVGRDRRPTLADRDRLQYMEAFTNEVQRFASVISLIPHGTTRDGTLKSYNIPKNTIIMANLYGIHHDSKVWGDPEVFRPGRFLDKEGRLIKNENLIPFSIGRRMCLGETLARTEIYLILTTLLQEYTPEPVGENLSLEHTFGLILYPKPYKIILRRRVESHTSRARLDIEIPSKLNTLPLVQTNILNGKSDSGEDADEFDGNHNVTLEPKCSEQKNQILKNAGGFYFVEKRSITSKLDR